MENSHKTHSHKTQMIQQPAQPDLISIVHDFIHALERRESFDEVRAFYHPDVVQIEYPNIFLKNGSTRTLQDLADASERGKKVMQKETFQVLNSYVYGHTVIVEVLWIGTLAVPIGQLPVGGEMKAHFAQFFEFADGKIIRQRNYDCFEPF
jgi:ketosteroid isomerase-like protein